MPPASSPAPAPGPTATTPEAAPAPTPAAAAATDERPPTYRAQPPGAATLHFSLRRGSLSGRGELAWRPAAERYDLVLRGTVLGITAITQDSSGRLGHTGLAPDRLIDQRRGRASLTATFDRAAGEIRFTRAPQPHPLVPGAQDRLSWMLQLPSILRAEPALRAPGSEVRMFVAGARGDGDVWEFVAVGREALPTQAGAIPQAEHWRRRPRGESGTRVDVWFDPQQDWLPVKVRMQSGGPDGESLELMLERIERG